MDEIDTKVAIVIIGAALILGTFYHIFIYGDKDDDNDDPTNLNLR